MCNKNPQNVNNNFITIQTDIFIFRLFKSFNRQSHLTPVKISVFIWNNFISEFGSQAIQSGFFLFRSSGRPGIEAIARSVYEVISPAIEFTSKQMPGHLVLNSS